MNEEQSFAIKFARMRRAGEYFKFDPQPLMWRRTDVPGVGLRAVPGLAGICANLRRVYSIINTL